MHAAHMHAAPRAAAGNASSRAAGTTTSVHQQRSDGRPAAIVHWLGRPQRGQRAGSIGAAVGIGDVTEASSPVASSRRR